MVQHLVWMGLMAVLVAGFTSPSAGAPVVPLFPRPWAIPAARSATIDYARGRYADAWLRHPILGDPSFDTFTRTPGNPLVKGSEPFLWPVNGSLFRDPVSGNWYAYVGMYLWGYDFGEGKPITHCQVYRSKDGMKSWQEVGPIFTDKSFRFNGLDAAVDAAPDVCVVYHNGKYHMSYDWVSNNTTWATASAPPPGVDGGTGYAWAERPEGPFHRSPNPILRASQVAALRGNDLRYRRPYATSIVRRKDDWLVISDLDSGPHFAWGQIAMTARDPMGPWSKPVMIASLEGDRFYPAPIEAFPCFSHGGYVYDPRTSVGRTRNFQAIYRAPIELAHEPSAWRLYQYGSAWHAEPSAHEGFGIWGQAFSGTVDPAGNLHVLFPTRTTREGVGAINIASRPWSKPITERGFVISAHGGPALTFTRTAYSDFSLDLECEARGTVRLAWGGPALVGPDGRADGVPDRISWNSKQALEISPEGWRLIGESHNSEERLVSGKLGTGPRHTVHLEVRGNEVSIAVDHQAALHATAGRGAGPLGLLLEPGSHLRVSRFEVRGAPAPAIHTWIAEEAIAGSGVSAGEWTKVKSPLFRFGQGGECARPDERLKWNFRGRGFRLWSPRGARYGRCRVEIDGVSLGEVDLHSANDVASAVVLERSGLADGYHALVVRGISGTLPVDCLDAVQ